LSALDEVDSERVDALISQFANQAELSKSLPTICRGFKLNDIRVNQLTRCLHAGSIDVQQLHGISCGQFMSIVSPDVVSELCKELLTKGVEGAWVALDIAFMYVYGDSAKWPPLEPTLKAILSTEGMLGSARQNDQIDIHAYAKVAEKLMEHDAEFARILTKEVINTAAKTKLVANIDHCLHEVLEALMAKQLDVAWPLIAVDLADEKDITKWRLANLIRGRIGRVGDAGLLGKIPNAYFVQWCKDLPDVAPRILAGFVNLIEAKGNKEWKISELAKLLIDNYGANPAVLSALEAN
jgi:hypothetical protein